jgi:hypothetical protein
LSSSYTVNWMAPWVVCCGKVASVGVGLHVCHLPSTAVNNQPTNLCCQAEQGMQCTSHTTYKVKKGQWRCNTRH